MRNLDVAIAGSGIVGLAVARALKEREPNLKIGIFEKEKQFSLHASSRNSGVLHAGFYYSPDSLKARFCMQGREELETFILKNSLPFKKVGKVVVATDEFEEVRLQTLYKRGLENGVELQLLEERQLSDIEPLARTNGSFLWSPNTSITNPALVNAALREELQEKGVEFFPSSVITSRSNKIFVNAMPLNARHFVNSTGGWALEIAQGFGIGSNLATMPFMGKYKKTTQAQLPLKRLVYPVPHPINPFLGVHLTLTVDGAVKIGPSAFPVIGKAQYDFKSGFTPIELVQFLRNLIALSRGDAHDLSSMLQYEFPKLFTRNLVRAVEKLVPDASNIARWENKSPGIRGQLINLESGELIQDFMVERTQNSTHILNAVSPGWTASLPFGRHLSSLVLETL